MDNYYRVLGLEQPRSRHHDLTASDIRRAYHAALLRHHPDKVPSPSSRSSSSSALAAAAHAESDGRRGSTTVDLITTAYKTLSDPTGRAAHDRALSRQPQDAGPTTHPSSNSPSFYYSGLDTVDLDDLDYDDSRGEWRRPCRCEHDEAFVVTETDLERVAEVGELVVGCRGCSLWLKVLFQPAKAVEEENAHGNAPEMGTA